MERDKNMIIKFIFNYIFKVLAKNGVRGWLDATNDKSNWLKLVRSSNYIQEVNLQHSLTAGQVFYF